MENYIYAENKVNFEMKGAQNVTKEILPRIGKSYQDAVKEILQNGRLYQVTLNDGYTVYGQKVRLARRVPEVGFIARVATEEKSNGKTYGEYIKEFTENKIAFDGKSIPQFIDTLEDVAKAEEKEKERAQKEAEKSAKKAEKAAKEDKNTTENK